MPNSPLPLVLALDNVRSLYNVGALFRTADAVNLEEMILGGLTPTPPRHEINKTALGAVHTVKWQYAANLANALLEWKDKGYHLAALEQTPEAVDFLQTKLPFPLVLVVGHEREGVSPEVLKLCSLHLSLPMQGKSAHSLNVSSAGSVALYEIGRRLWYDKHTIR